LHKQPKKNKEIAFVGRLVQEKGVHVFIQSIRSLVKKYPEWKFRIIGTSKAGNEKLITSYEKKIIKDFIALGHNTEYSGFLSNNEVKEIMKTLSILVVPSLWREPFGLVALEGFCYGVAVIASKVGGLNEMLDGTGLLIKDIDEIKLEKSITSLIQNKKLLKDYQNKSWINYKFNQSQIVKKQDRIRNEIFNSFYLS
jgi:glycosyltransferase involved in cell wall biosynthesis